MTVWSGDLLSPPLKQPAGPLAQMVQVVADTFNGLTAGLPRQRRRRIATIAAALAVAVGTVIGFARARAAVLPGLGGAAAVSVGVGEITGHIFGHGLAPWVSILVGGLFLLAIDRQITLRTPRAGNGRGG